MVKIIHILRYEIYMLVNRWSFWFGVLGLPVIGFLIYSGIGWFNNRQGGITTPQAQINQLFTQKDDNRPQGYVDLAGIVKEYPVDFNRKQYIDYANSQLAENDLSAGKISAYYVIPADFLQTGAINAYTKEYNLISSQSKSTPLRNLIDYNLLQANPKLTDAIENPLGVMQKNSLSPNAAKQRDNDNAMTFFLPYSVMMFFYIAIMGSSGLLLNSVSKEKENRVIEILMISTDTQNLLIGKMIGLGLVSLLQMGIWGLSGFFLLRLSGETFQLPAEFQLDPSVLAWGLIFFILGYLVYGALMAGVGALVPNLREGSQATTLIILPMMLPIFLLNALIRSPNGWLSVAFSLFPLTAPTTMMLRLAATDLVPLWQLILSVVLLVAADYLTIRVVARFFRAQTLLSGQSFNIKRFALALAGRL